MRISADRSDPGFSPVAQHFEAFLDGVSLPFCVTADEDLGEAVVQDRDAAGKLVPNDAGDNVRLKIVKGKVEIRPRAASMKGSET